MIELATKYLRNVSSEPVMGTWRAAHIRYINEMFQADRRLYEFFTHLAGIAENYDEANPHPDHKTRRILRMHDVRRLVFEYSPSHLPLPSHKQLFDEACSNKERLERGDVTPEQLVPDLVPAEEV